MEPKQGTTAESENTVIVCEHDDIDSKGLPIFLLNFQHQCTSRCSLETLQRRRTGKDALFFFPVSFKCNVRWNFLPI